MRSCEWRCRPESYACGSCIIISLLIANHYRRVHVHRRAPEPVPVSGPMCLGHSNAGGFSIGYPTQRTAMCMCLRLHLWLSACTGVRESMEGAVCLVGLVENWAAKHGFPPSVHRAKLINVRVLLRQLHEGFGCPSSCMHALRFTALVRWVNVVCLRAVVGCGKCEKARP